jgi:hypothetical protein
MLRLRYSPGVATTKPAVFETIASDAWEIKTGSAIIDGRRVFQQGRML